MQDSIKLRNPGNDGENGASPVPPADNGNHFQSYTFQDTGSQNVKLYLLHRRCRYSGNASQQLNPGERVPARDVLWVPPTAPTR